MGRNRQIAGVRAKNFKPPRLTTALTNGVKKGMQNYLLELCDRGKILKKVYRKYILEKSKDGFDSRKWMDNLYHEGEIKKEDYENYSSSEDEEPVCSNSPPEEIQEEKDIDKSVHSGPELPVSNEETSMNEQEDSKSKLSPSEKERIQLALNKIVEHVMCVDD